MPLEALTCFLTDTYTVTRPGDGAYVVGVWTPTAGSTFPIDASIQPLNGKELRLLPEGFTVDGTKKLYTETLLKAGANAAQSDTVAIGSETWRVIQVSDYQGNVNATLSRFYKAIIAKKDTPA